MKKLSVHAPLIQEAEAKELSNLQKDWREYFGAKLAKFDATSPADLDEEKKKEFFNDLKKDWEKGKGIKPEAKEALEKDKEKAEDKKAEEPAENVADLKGSPEDKLKELTKEGKEVNESKEITAEELVKKIIKGNSRFKWLNNELPKNYTLDDVKNALDGAGYGNEYDKYIKEGEGINEAGEFKVGDKVALLSKADKKKFDAGVVTKIQSDGNVVVNKTKNFNNEIVMDPAFLVKESEEANEEVNEGRSIETVSKDISKLAAEMMDLAKVWKTAEGKAKTEVLDSLKAKTADKKKLEKELNDIIAGKDKDIELIVMEAESVDEAEVKTEAEFKEYAEKVLKKAHPDDFDEDKANKTIDGILKKAKGDLGAAVGMLTSSLG